MFGVSKVGVVVLIMVLLMGKLGVLILIGSFGGVVLMMFEISGYCGLMVLFGVMFMLLVMFVSVWLFSLV